jgi:hypothetical protein
MKKIKNATCLFFICAVLFAACSKTGPQGPAGAQGEQGVKGDKGDKGDQGPQGVQGNANVILYDYGSRTFAGLTTYTLSNISSGRIDSSFTVAYYNPSLEVATAWYPIPGLGNSGFFETRCFLYQTRTSPSTYSFEVRLTLPGGSGSYSTSVTWTKTRIFLIKASQELPGGRRKPLPDYNNYHQVCRYYGVRE